MAWVPTLRSTMYPSGTISHGQPAEPHRFVTPLRTVSRLPWEAVVARLWPVQRLALVHYGPVLCTSTVRCSSPFSVTFFFDPSRTRLPLHCVATASHHTHNNIPHPSCQVSTYLVSANLTSLFLSSAPLLLRLSPAQNPITSVSSACCTPHQESIPFSTYIYTSISPCALRAVWR